PSPLPSVCPERLPGRRPSPERRSRSSVCQGVRRGLRVVLVPLSGPDRVLAGRQRRAGETPLSVSAGENGTGERTQLQLSNKSDAGSRGAGISVGGPEDAAEVAEVLPVLCLRGLSTGDFREALAALLGDDAAGLSATNIARLTNEWEAEYRA